MATQILADDVAPLRYTECDWGDLIEGSKEQLQALGLGVGLAFPGEPSAPKRDLQIKDPRGYAVRISSGYRSDGRFAAYLHFPDWPERPDSDKAWESFAPGVKLNKSYWVDEFVGSAEALAAAKLLSLDQLPGQPGMRKVRVSIFPDGTVPKVPPTVNLGVLNLPGARMIERASATTFKVSVVLTKDEAEERRVLRDAAVRQWEQKVRALRRPARLRTALQMVDAGGQCSAPAATRPRDHLRLVWGERPAAPLAAPETSETGIRVAGSAAPNRDGWPLSPVLLAALRKATPMELWQCENAVRAMLDMPFNHQRPES